MKELEKNELKGVDGGVSFLELFSREPIYKQDAYGAYLCWPGLGCVQVEWYA